MRSAEKKLLDLILNDKKISKFKNGDIEIWEDDGEIFTIVYIGYDKKTNTIKVFPYLSDQFKIFFPLDTNTISGIAKEWFREKFKDEL